jgi:formiminoglutamase
MTMSAFEFQLYDTVHHNLPFQRRDGETRVGEHFSQQVLNAAKYVLIGVSENVGPQANWGRHGSENAFEAFSKVFFNTQFYPEVPLQNLAFLGEVKQVKQALDRSEATLLVEELDQLILEVLTQYLAPHQIPILVGGGHNNALPLMRWAASNGKLSVVNIDAHADLRPTDKRHSGNSFSFALQEGLLENYGIFGLHEAFNNTHIRNELNSSALTHRFYEDYLQGPYQLLDDVMGFVSHQHHAVGIEIDMDSIALMPSSAFSPSGWTLDQIRAVILKLGHIRPQIAYLNLTEAAPIDERDDLIVGKALSYLVRDFVRMA